MLLYTSILNEKSRKWYVCILSGFHNFLFFKGIFVLIGQFTDGVGNNGIRVIV